MAREILEHPNTSAMLAVLELDHPAKNGRSLRDGFDATYRIGQIDGFEQCLTMLRELGTPAPIPPGQIAATWGADEPEGKK